MTVRYDSIIKNIFKEGGDNNGKVEFKKNNN